MTMKKMMMLRSLSLMVLLAGAGCELDELDEATDEIEELGQHTSALASYSRSIQNVYSGKCLDIPWGSTAEGAPVNQYTCHGGPAQQFVVEPHPQFGGWVRIRNLRSNLCVAGVQNTSTESTRLIQVRCNDLYGVNWERNNIEPLNGGYRARFRWTYDSAYCIDVPGDRWWRNSIQLQAYRPCHHGALQQFEIRP
jgi:hypothetical protein